ncbi:MAG: hypothetical protein GY796_24660 [Chloroflexi bacterium]|nr:hypothetical protein [Chloroflexota bacterium]
MTNMPLKGQGMSEDHQIVSERWLWRVSFALFLVATLVAAMITPTRAETQLEQVLESAKIYGLISGTANQCRNLTLAKHPKLHEAIRVYWRSETPAVRKKFHEARRIAIARVRKDGEQTCNFMAKTMPWMFEETRDKVR